MSNSEIIIIDKSEKSIEKTSKLLKNISDFIITQTDTSLDILSSKIIEMQPAIILIGPEFTIVDLENFIKSNSGGLGNFKIILLVNETSSNIFRKAIKLNIFDVLEFPFNYNDLKESLSRAHATIVSSTSKKSPPSGSETKKNGNKAKSIIVFSSKGGTGKSFIAANLAIDIYNQTKSRVSLIDLNYESGDIALILDLTPKHTVYDISAIIDQLDVEMLNSFLTVHSSGIKVLPAPVDPAQSESISTKTTLKILDELMQISDYIIIDSPSSFSENNLAILEKVDFLCMVASMDILSIKNLKVAIEVIEQLKFDQNKIFIVINRANSKVGITSDEIEVTLTKKIDITIPSDRLVPLSINQGNPIAVSYPRSPVGRSINKLTQLLIKRN